MSPKNRWESIFSAPPLGYLLRQQLGPQWFRIHGLPNSDRLPSNKSELKEMLHRYNEVTSTVIGTDSQCDVWMPVSRKSKNWGVEWEPSEPFTKWNDDSEIVEELECRLFLVRTLVWSQGCLDDALTQVATGIVSGLVIFSLSTHKLVCPYEGGADIFLGDADLVPSTRALFTDWLSPLENGL
jgi:hypothetical protein